MHSPPTATSAQLDVEFARFRDAFPYRFLTVDGVPWRYLDAGTGDSAILMLPGGSYRPDNYFRLITDLAGDHRVIAPAYPAVHPLPKVLRGLAAILDEAGLGALTVFGCSYGGYVAQAMTKDMPDRVGSLVLAQAGTRHIIGLRGMRLFTACFALMPPAAKRAFTWRLWMRWFTAPPESAQFWLARLRAELAEMTGAQLLAGARNIVDFMAHYAPAPGWLRPWNGPLLILESLHDQAFSTAQRAELRQAYPRATVRSLDAGHTALFGQPEQFTAEIRQFGAAHPATGAQRPAVGEEGR